MREIKNITADDTDIPTVTLSAFCVRPQWDSFNASALAKYNEARFALPICSTGSGASVGMLTGKQSKKGGEGLFPGAGIPAGGHSPSC
jgi:hypothetical protein